MAQPGIGWVVSESRRGRIRWGTVTNVSGDEVSVDWEDGKRTVYKNPQVQCVLEKG